MDKKIVFMFSGQGSQYYNMGKKLYDSNQSFKKWMTKLDELAIDKNKKNIPLIDIIYDKNKKMSEAFDCLLYTHPAIFMVEFSLAQALIESGIEPDYVLGTSLGEYISLAIADVINVDELFEALIKQAEIFETYCKTAGMMAILYNYEIFQKTPEINENSELVSINYNEHFVISGEKEKLNIIEKYLRKKDISYQILPVSYGFHSSLINPVEKYFKEHLNFKEYRKPKIPFVSSVEAKILNNFSDDYFWNVVRKPIKFPEAVQELEKKSSNIYIDLGPSGTLAVFIKNLLDRQSKSEHFSIMTVFGNDLNNMKKVIDLFPVNKIENKKRRKNNMIAYVFPGQGSQHKGMGKDLFDEFKEFTEEADDILGYSIKELCLEDTKNQLGETQYTQPALFVVNALSYLKKIKESNIKPDYVAGHSLGEYNALFAAAAFDFGTGLKLVKKRGELMSKATGGGMAAIIGLSEEKIQKVLDEKGLKNIDVANYNTPSQIVISGPKDDIEKAKAIFEAAGAQRYIVLNVSGAFHSRYMEDSMKKFKEYLDSFKLSELQIPVISNVTARPYNQKDLKDNLINQITHSVKWTESIRYLMGKSEINIEQVGPGMVLTGMVKSIQKEAEPLIVNEEEEMKSTEKSKVKKKEEKKEEVKEKKAETVEAKAKAKKEELKEENVKTEKKETAKSGTKKKEVKEKQKEPVSAKTAKENKKDSGISALSLGSEELKREYKIRYAYMTGSMYKGIASKEIVVKMGKAGMMGFLGTGGLELSEIEESIKYIQNELNQEEAYGVNLLYNPVDQQTEEDMVDLYLKYGVKNVEASAYMSITPALVRYRLKGLKRGKSGKVEAVNKVIAKVSRPEVAEVFLAPAPERVLKKLLEEGKITKEEAEMSKAIAMADDLCAEADSGGHTDQGVAYALMPAIIKLRDEMMKKYKYPKKIRIGAAGGIGTPEAAAAAFILGADFIITGSINQCTVEAGTSDAVKDLLQQANVQDTEYAPAGDMFELGAKVQVLKRGLFFPARANKLYELYRHYNSINDIDEKTKKQIQERYFHKSFDDVYKEVKEFYPHEEIERAEKNPKQKMALIFRWYFGYSTRLALSGSSEQKVDYQVHCGPALGAFNQWVKETELENWRNRHVDEIAEKIMIETAELLNKRFNSLLRA